MEEAVQLCLVSSTPLEIHVHTLYITYHMTVQQYTVYNGMTEAEMNEDRVFIITGMLAILCDTSLKI